MLHLMGNHFVISFNLVDFGRVLGGDSDCGRLFLLFFLEEFLSHQSLDELAFGDFGDAVPVLRDMA